jgi:hypothetical protein
VESTKWQQNIHIGNKTYQMAQNIPNDNKNIQNGNKNIQNGNKNIQNGNKTYQMTTKTYQIAIQFAKRWL